MISGAAVSVNQKGIYPGPTKPGMSNLRRAHLGRRAMNVPTGIGTVDVLPLIAIGFLFSPVIIISYVAYRLGKRARS